MTDRRHVWTDENIGELRRLWDEGLTARAIGEAIGFGKNSVISKSHRLHLPSRPSPLNVIARDANIDAKPRTRRTPEQVAARAAPKPPPVVIARDVAIDVAAPPPPPPPPPVPSVRVCQYPHGDPGEPGFRFCEAPVRGRGVYCREHYAAAYIRYRSAA